MLCLIFSVPLLVEKEIIISLKHSMDPRYKRQPYKYDTQVYLWTTVFTIAILLLISTSIAFISQWWIILVLIVVCSLLLYFIIALPRAFEETETEYIVHLLMYKKRFSKSEFTAEPVTKSVLKDSVRTFATGGAFGYTGYWWSPVIKNFYSCVANVNMPLILLTRKDSKRKPKVFLVNGTLADQN